MSMSCAVILTLLPAFLTLPSIREPAFNSFPTSAALFCEPLYFMTDVLAMTVSCLTPERDVISSSVIPSAKYPSSRLELRFAKGRTAIRLLSRAAPVASCLLPIASRLSGVNPSKGNSFSVVSIPCIHLIRRYFLAPPSDCLSNISTLPSKRSTIA